MFNPDCQGFCLLIATHSDTHSHIDGVKHRPVYWEKLEVQGLISHRPATLRLMDDLLYLLRHIHSSKVK